jgi:predicted hydrolase (HD superfamily)
MNYYKVTQIEFDFDYEDLTEEEKNEIVNETTNCLWDSPEEENLADVITNNTGWCIKSLSYDIIRA